jgi:hypothetical protein
MAFLQAVVEALVALFEHGSYGAVVGPPRSVVVDLSSSSWGPDEDLQGVGVVLALATMGYVPILSLSCLLQEGKNVRI